MEQEAYPKPPAELIMSDESIARVRRLMGSLGVCDALEDELPDDPIHTDSIWIVRGQE